MGCRAEIQLERGTYPVTNDPGLVDLMRDVVPEMDPQAQIANQFQTMGSEDFSFMMQDIPGCFIMVGSSNKEKGYIRTPSPQIQH